MTAYTIGMACPPTETAAPETAQPVPDVPPDASNI